MASVRWANILGNVAANDSPGLANVQQLPDFNELARRIEMRKQDLERLTGRERQCFEAARKAQAATEECREEIKAMKQQWADLAGELLNVED